ncbi:PDR/VanB family oxidoreductase [Hydrogenophaga sp. OTU3427]|uniref:PDR/VanB family oxidoreductase n=1 Tax=Hydrogenophaga sp. OTU3427 TaxID=3043856 RepID=UPI00313AFED4
MSSKLEVQVVASRMLNPLICALTLRATDGAALPGFSAGAHVRVSVTLPDGTTDWRHYSLIDLGTGAGATEAPARYTIAVRREDEGRGGSRYMHTLREGDTLSIEPPRNDFPLAGVPAGRAVLVAGGIGVTPLTGMAAACRAQGRPVRLVYAGRSRELMAFLPELQALLGDDLVVHADAEQGAPLDAGALLDACGADDTLHVCGPRVMLDAVLAAAQARGWAPERVRFELFAAPAAQAGDQPFEVVLAQSGQTLTVPADQTLLDCLVAHGCDPLFDCQRGECGVCAVPVIEGEVDHRDHVLSASEKAAGRVMQICVSRAKGARLVLDL